MDNTIVDSAIDMLKELEGFRSAPYHGELDPPDIFTIGYGHTHGVTMATKPVTEEEADDLLWDDLEPCEDAIDDNITVPLTDNQYSALCLLVFNVGPKPLTETLGEKLNAKDYQGAADEFLKWNHAGGRVSDGLTARRTKERALFITT